MSLLKLLTVIADRADRDSPLHRHQIDEVNLDKLGARVETVASRAMVLAHAYDVMREGKFPHPLDAFLHAWHCVGPDNEDGFDKLFAAWVKLCADCVNVVQLSLDVSEALREHAATAIGGRAE